MRDPVADNPRDQGICPGAGLGLAIVAAAATAHDGTAEAALNCPHGLTVTLTLPLAGEERASTGMVL